MNCRKYWHEDHEWDSTVGSNLDQFGLANDQSADIPWYDRDQDRSNRRYFRTIAKHAVPEKRQLRKAKEVPRWSKKTEDHKWSLIQKGNVGSLTMAGREHDPNANGADSRRVFHGPRGEAPFHASGY